MFLRPVIHLSLPGEVRICITGANTPHHGVEEGGGAEKGRRAGEDAATETSAGAARPALLRLQDLPPLGS